jgi:SpoVK/Ycf46/Vps4 family AAA+-type ATPase
MARGELLKKLFISHSRGDDTAFRDVALQIIDQEEKKNNRLLASALRRSLAARPPAINTQRRLEVVPYEKDKQLPLVEEVEPARRAADIVLSRENQQLLLTVLEEFRRNELIRSHGIRVRSKLLFCGPPGCGKTLCAEVFAHEAHLPLVVASMDSLVSSYLGETATNLRRVFEYASSRPVVLLLDEFDAIGRLRDDETQHGELKRVVNSLLQFIEKYSGTGFIIAATNHERQLDPAIWRRFDEIVYFSRPTRQEVARLLKLTFKNFQTSFDLQNKVARLEGLSHAEIERVCVNAIRRSILDKRDRVEERFFDQAVKFELRRKGIAERLTTN